MTQRENRPIIRNADYSAFLKDVKQRIQSAQIKAAVRVNQELLTLYWDLGEQIIEKQREASWGDGFLKQMSHDLQAEFPGLTGFSFTNLWSRAVLTHQIESGLYQREGKAITNFEATLPAPQSDLAIQMLKDPYNFDFLMLRERHDEKELEAALTDHTVVEYSLKDVHKPIGVSEYLITKSLPNELKSSLPSIEEIEAELSEINGKGATGNVELN